MRKILLLIFVFVLASCGTVRKNHTSSILVESAVTDRDYGFVANKPIKLGGFMRGTKHSGYHREFFSKLVGPNGQRVKSRRLGRCCAFLDKSLPFGAGFLDKYELSYKGNSRPVVIYVDLYKYDQPRAPQGFRLK